MQNAKNNTVAVLKSKTSDNEKKLLGILETSINKYFNINHQRIFVMQFLSLCNTVPNTISSDKTIILKPNIHKPRAFAEWFETAWENLFKTIYGVTLRLKLGEDQFEYASDFIVCVNTNRILTTLLRKNNLKMCFFGDFYGGTAVLGLAELVPDVACIVSFQNETDKNRLRMNMGIFFHIASEYFQQKQIEHKYKNARVILEPESFAEYNSEDTKRKTLQGPCSLHNRLPWEFMKWCPENFIFDVIHFEVPWNLHVQKDMLALKEKMENRTQEENFNMPFEPFENDLKFFENEASHFDTLKNMDSFFLRDMEKRNITSNFIVVNIRGELTASEWKRLDDSGSLLTKKYQVRFQIEQLPNERIERLKYNPETKEFDRLIEKLDLPGNKPMQEAKDVNGGIRGKIMVVIFQKSESGKFYDLDSTCTKIPYKDLYEKWYGTYMNTRDSAKHGLFVDKRTHEPLCERIKRGPSKVRIFTEDGTGHSNVLNLPDEYCTKIPARKRRIQVQIEDLELLLRECKLFVKEIKSGISIPPERLKRIMKYIAHGEYSYKYNDCCISQAEVKDTAERKKFGHDLILRKTELYHEVHHIMRAIEKHCHWEMEAVVKHPDKYEPLPVVPDAYKREHRISNMKYSINNQKKIGCTMNSIQQFSIESKPMTLGGSAHCYDEDYDSEDDWDDFFDQYDDFFDNDEQQEEADDWQERYQNQFDDRQDAIEQSRNDRKDWDEGNNSRTSSKGTSKNHGSTDKSALYDFDPSSGNGDSGGGGPLRHPVTKPNKQGFSEVRHKNGRGEVSDMAHREAMKRAFLRTSEGKYWQLIRNLGFHPSELPGFDTLSFEELYAVACDEMKRREKTDPQFYYSHMLQEMGINPRIIHEWAVEKRDLKQLYFDLKEQEQKEFQEEQIKRKKEEQINRKQQQQDANWAIQNEESEAYYQKECEIHGVSFDLDEYKGKSYKEIYLMWAKANQFIAKPYNPNQTPESSETVSSRKQKQKQDKDNKSNSHHEPQEIGPLQPTWATTKKESVWSGGKGKAHESGPKSVVFPHENERERPIEETRGHGQKSRVFRDQSTGRSNYIPSYIPYYDRHQDKDFLSFMKKLKENWKAQEENPKAAWHDYVERKKKEDRVQSASEDRLRGRDTRPEPAYDRTQPSYQTDTGPEQAPDRPPPRHQTDTRPEPVLQEPEVNKPENIAGCKWYDNFADFVKRNIELFGFTKSEIVTASRVFIRPINIRDTVELYYFKKEYGLQNCDIETDHKNQIIALIGKIQRNKGFVEYARSILGKKPEIVGGCKWYDTLDSFVYNNLEQFGFSSEREAYDFLITVDIFYTVGLYNFSEQDMQRCGLDIQHKRQIIRLVDQIRDDKNFQRYARFKVPDYKTPEELV